MTSFGQLLRIICLHYFSVMLFMHSDNVDQSHFVRITNEIIHADDTH